MPNLNRRKRRQLPHLLPSQTGQLCAQQNIRKKYMGNMWNVGTSAGLCISLWASESVCTKRWSVVFYIKCGCSTSRRVPHNSVCINVFLISRRVSLASVFRSQKFNRKRLKKINRNALVHRFSVAFMASIQWKTMRSWASVPQDAAKLKRFVDL